MTKESKLALIIGFVLVLVVGVLVSDHFSQASKMSHDTLEPGEAEVSTPIASLGDRDRNAINSIPSPVCGKALQEHRKLASPVDRTRLWFAARPAM